MDYRSSGVTEDGLDTIYISSSRSSGVDEHGLDTIGHVKYCPLGLVE